MLNQSELTLSKSNINSTLTTTVVLSSYTAQILSRYKYAKIHSIFPNGFNLNFKGYLVYVTYHQEAKLSALGMMIDRHVFNQLYSHLKLGQLVRFRDDSFTFYIQANPLTLSFNEQKIKNLTIDKELIDKRKAWPLKDCLAKINLIDSSGFSKNKELLNSYHAIQVNKNITKKNINNLIGAGIGLTPTGDDFLQGLILMEKILGHSPEIEAHVKRGLEQRSTTDVSLSYYQALFEGYYNEPLAELFKAVNEENKEDIQKSILLVQEYGETSGFDLLTGILTYLEILKE